MARRIIFSFDDEAEQALEALETAGSFRSKGDVVRSAVTLLESLRPLLAAGFTEMILRNPKNKREKQILLPPVLTKLKN